MPKDNLTLRERKHIAIIDAARAAFKEHGVDGTSMDTIADLADVSKKTVYNHFASKELLVLTLIKEQWQTAILNMSFVYSQGRPLRDQLVEILLAEARVVSTEEYLGLARAAMSFFLYKPDLLKQEVEKMCSERTELSRCLELAVADGRLNCDDIRVMEDQLHALLKGGCFWPQLTRMGPILTETEIQQTVERSVDMFLAYYGVE